MCAYKLWRCALIREIIKGNLWVGFGLRCKLHGCMTLDVPIQCILLYPFADINKNESIPCIDFNTYVKHELGLVHMYKLLLMLWVVFNIAWHCVKLDTCSVHYTHIHSINTLESYFCIIFICGGCCHELRLGFFTMATPCNRKENGHIFERKTQATYWDFCLDNYIRDFPVVWQLKTSHSDHCQIL